METNADKLVPIESRFWPELRDKFLINWPEYCIGYYTIENYIKWKKIDTKYKCYEVYCLNGDWSDGTFVVIDDQYLYCYTLNENLNNLEKLIYNLPPDKTYILAGIETRHIQAAYDAIAKRNWKLTFAQAATYLFKMSKEKALELEYSIPEGFIVKEMPPEKVEEANSVYPYSAEDTLLHFQKLCDLNLNRGVFDAEGNLLAWCYHYHLGLNALQTHEHARKRGLASLLTKIMAIELAKEGQDTIACIITVNDPSIVLFRKLGFEYTGQTLNWLGFTSTR